MDRFFNKPSPYNLLLFFIIFNISLSGEERILNFNSDININRDASMIVQETITVVVEGIKIKRGIFRDFPTEYKDSYGNNYKVGFNIIEILRDGQPDEYRIEDISNGKRIYIGNKDYFLRPGSYTYTITYKTNRQISFFNDHDELYWNVTGNGWDFNIEKASSTVHLPSTISPNEMNCFAFTGEAGTTGRNYLNKKEISSAIFYTNKILKPREGLTIVLEWPKGVIAEPTSMMKAQYFIADNLNILIGLLGLIIILIYYLLIWNRVGKDPEKGTIFPQYTPPDNFSPAAMRFIKKMKFDNKSFAASIVNMAVKGYLSITETEGKYFLIKGKSGLEVLNNEEKRVASKLSFNSKSSAEDFKQALEQLNNKIGSGNIYGKKLAKFISKNLTQRAVEEKSGSVSEKESVLELDQKNHSIISSSIKELKDALKKNYEKIYFITNLKEFAIGAVLSIIFIIAMGISGSPEQLFLTIWLTIWSFCITMLLNVVVRTWESLLHKGRFKFSGLIGALFISAFSLPFVLGELAGIYFLTSAGSYLTPVIIGILVFVNILFYHLLKAPTLAGRKLLDRIEGFKLYLSVTEKERYNFLQRPEKTPELFEKYLPYAIALDVENEWADKFAQVLNKTTVQTSSYQPGWYSGPSWNSFNPAGFSSSLGSSFSSAISSSSTAPGSSSGSGGSSGGGGGGGGGGGW